VSSIRLWIMLAIFTIFGLYNLFTVFKLQILQYNDLSTRAEQRIKRKETLVPRRGLIYDTRGQLLAGNATAYDVYVDLTHRKKDAQLHEIADLLAPTLNQNPQTMFTRFGDMLDQGVNYVKVANRIDPAKRDKIEELAERYDDVLGPVVNYETQSLRNYPNTAPHGGGGLAASLLGFTDYDNVGHYGIEEFYNAKLAGEAGWIDAERDAYGNPLVLQQPEMQPAVDGSDLVLTIDSAVQYLVERELKASIEEFKADSGYAIVQDPSTGAILAIADYPTFDANKFNEVTNYELFKNPAVTDVREPGSTMKVLTYAAAIDAGAVMSSTGMYGTACVYKYSERLCNATFTEWGWQTMMQGLGRSDNVAAMFAAEQLGPDKYYEYIKRFGIGTRTGIDLSGEVAGLVSWPGSEYYSPVDFYTTAFGQSAATTPIQLVNAVSAVANGGVLLKPYVMKEIRAGGEVVDAGERQEVRRVIDATTSRDIADMLAYGVENGMVARFSAVPGYHVSVKTGTANVLNDNGIGYKDGVTFASAMGFAPSHNPRFTLYIGIMHPRTSPWGENTTSVSWGRLAKELLLYMKVQPTGPLPTPTAGP
jgi:cell division protein FtsI/penicillin-binding protein 2